MTIVVGIASFVLGLYSGKKRARGLGWMDVGRDFCHDVRSVASKVFAAAFALFRRDVEAPKELPDAPNR